MFILVKVNNKISFTMKIKVLAVDDHPSTLEGLRSLVECENDMEFVGGADNGESALKMIKATKADLVMMDVQLQGDYGYNLIKQISSNNKIKVLAFSGYDNPRFIRKMLCSGAEGYILKSSNINKISEAIRTIVKGGIFLDSKLNHNYSFYTSETDKLEKLTTKERKRFIKEKKV